MTKKIINTSIIQVLFVFSAPLPLPVVVVGIINTFHVNNGLISLLFLSWSLFFFLLSGALHKWPRIASVSEKLHKRASYPLSVD